MIALRAGVPPASKFDNVTMKPQDRLSEFDERCGNPYLNFMDLSISDKEKNVIKMRLENHTLEEVAKEYGVTRERIRQIEAKANEKIRLQNYTKDFIRTTILSVLQEQKAVVEGSRRPNADLAGDIIQRDDYFYNLALSDYKQRLEETIAEWEKMV